MNTIDFDDALKAAERSTIKSFKTGAAIYDRDGNLLSIGWSHVPEFRLRSTPWSRHAESHALKRCHSIDKAHTIVIATKSGRSGNITCGNPCTSCASQLSRTNIKNVVATQKLDEE